MRSASTCSERALLVDGAGRRLDYLRLSVTERCNLRCRYCLPEGSIDPAGDDELLTLDEMFQVCTLFTELGVRKIRLTGGEPLLRNRVLEFLSRLATLPTSPELLLTTNGLLLERMLPRLAEVGVSRLNVSLDSLCADKYRTIARREGLDRVLSGLRAADEMGFGIKVNTVVMAGVNDNEITDFVALTRDRDWTVRFIEAMPFDGRGGNPADLLDGDQIIAVINRRYELKQVISEACSVAELYRVPGFCGRVGIIRGHSRTFCASCNRLRISARGELRTCLYGQPVLDLRNLLRQNTGRREIVSRITAAVSERAIDGRAAETAGGNSHSGSMSRIGG